MLTRLRMGLDLSVFCTTALAGIALLLSGCGSPDPATQSQARAVPAVNVPHGLIDLATRKSTLKPRARAVSALTDLGAQDGLGVFTLGTRQTPSAVLIKLDLTRFAPQIIADRNGISPMNAIAQEGVTVIVGSSFVSQVRQMQPIGVLQVDGTLLQDVEPHGYTRILGISTLEPPQNSTRFEVMHRSQWPTQRFHSALQAGPGIIEKGLLDISERDLERPKYFRSFVAECGNASVVGTTLVPMHLYTLGTKLVEFFKQNQLNCSEVVNLAGDREAVLLVRKGSSAAYLGDPEPAKAGLISFVAVETNEAVIE